MKPTIYIISGVGADKRMFRNFSFEEFNIIHIDWISPLEHESLSNYAFRISKVINDENAIIIGLSFGGIISVEISKIKKLKKIFLLSSAKTKNEIPFYLRIFGKLNILKIIPTSFLKQTNFLVNFIFGAKTTFEKQLLKDIIKNTDERFLKWSLNQIINWKNTEFPENIIHIQGNKDLILPHYFVKYNFLIEKGTHFMILNKSIEIEKIILENLSSTFRIWVQISKKKNNILLSNYSEYLLKLDLPKDFEINVQDFKKDIEKGLFFDSK